MRNALNLVITCDVQNQWCLSLNVVYQGSSLDMPKIHKLSCILMVYNRERPPWRDLEG